MNLTIRTGRPADAAALTEFNRAMALETESLELDPGRLAAGVEAVLSDAEKGFYLVAESGGRTVGALMVTYEWSDWRNGVFWWIQSVYVEPPARGQGVYRSLYVESVERARRAGNVCGLRLYVEKSNGRAQQAYRNLGMRKTGYDMYEVDFVLERGG